MVDPRHLVRRLVGDLDSIILKAMRKEPQQRYSTAEQLSDDIGRHLGGQPVGARTGTFTYRTSRFLKRNRLATLIILGFVLLGVGLGLMWRQAELQRQRADAERLGNQKAVEFLVTIFKASDPNEAEGANLTDLDLLQRAKSDVKELSEQLDLQIEVAGALGDLFRDRGLFEDSKEMMELALGAAEKRYPGDHPEVAKQLNNLAAVTNDLQRYPEAEKLFRQVLEMRKRLGQPIAELNRNKSNLAAVLVLLNRLEEAETLYREVLVTRRDLYGNNDQDLASTRRSLGAVYYARGDFPRAESELREALRIRRDVFGLNDTRVASVFDLLGRVQAAQNKTGDAKSLYDQALDIRTRILPSDHPDIARTQRNLAELFIDSDTPRAEKLLQQALAIFHEKQPADSWEIAEAESIRGEILTVTRRYPEAESTLLDSYDRLKDRRGLDNFRTRKALERILRLYTLWDQPEKLAIYQAIADKEPTTASRSEPAEANREE